MTKIKSLRQLDKRTNSQGNKLAVFYDSGKAVRRIVTKEVVSLLGRLEVEVLYVNLTKLQEAGKEYGIWSSPVTFMPYRDGNLVDLPQNGSTTPSYLRRKLSEWYR